MPDTLNLIIPLSPQQKGRPKCNCRKLPGGRVVANMYTETAARVWMKDCAIFIHSHWRGGPMPGPLRVKALFVKRRPAGRPKPPIDKAGHFYVTKEMWSTGDRIPAPTTPDLDNYAKALLDACTKAGIWHDDGQVVTTEMSKWYAAKDERPHIELWVDTL